MSKMDIATLLEEMGEKRFKQYMKAYVSVTKDLTFKGFGDSFKEYIEACRKKSKKGTGCISILGYKMFLLGLDLGEIMKDKL